MMQIQPVGRPIPAPRRPLEEVIAPYRHLLGDQLKLDNGALARLRAYAVDHQLGQPTSNPTRWNGLTVQRYPVGPALLVDDGRQTFQVRHGFYEFYTRPGAQQALGAPREEEHWEGNRVVQRFEKAMLTWQPNQAVVIAPKAPPAPAPGAPAKPDVMVQGPNGPKALRNGFLEFYNRPGAKQALGAPLEDEHWEGDTVVQRFEKAMLSWQPNKAVTIGPKR